MAYPGQRALMDGKAAPRRPISTTSLLTFSYPNCWSIYLTLFYKKRQSVLQADYKCIIMGKKEGGAMEDPVLKIKKRRYAGDSAVVTLRIPKDMVKDLDHIAESTGRTRNEIMSTCLEFAIEHMVIQLNTNNKEGEG